ncbi:MAG: YebC/PmpR family DNA-binding transcriptional regulator [Clostridia bacterium]|nr:YebC/PmpR family DNA-binding transcriptional regulator [Clostridia bacterium]
MSGHSKWHNIQAKKGKTDAARGAIFTKIGRELTVAAKGNPNPDTNSKLADVIAKAKAANMPNDNIKRIISKASGEGADKDYKEVTYEGYGVGGSAVMIRTLTDNVNRTVSGIRSTMSRYGGEMGNSGCVAYMFDNKGVIVIERTVELDEDTMMEYCLDCDADDFVAEDDVYEITTTPEKFSSVRKYFEDKGIEFLEAEVKMVPQSYIDLTPEKLGTFRKMLDKLDENDDVQEVYHNVNMPDDEEEEE